LIHKIEHELLINNNKICVSCIKMDRKKRLVIICLIIIFIGVSSAYYFSGTTKPTSNTRHVISTVTLPAPKLTGNVSVEAAIQNRRSVRHYSNQSVTLGNVSQILWSAQGITDTQKQLRATPSAGQVYPLEVYVIAGPNVSGLDEGVYQYEPSNNTLEKLMNGDLRTDLSNIADGQPWVKQAPLDILITGNNQKMIDKYPDKALSTRFVDIEAGHAGENIYLQSVSLGLVTVSLGSFDSNQLTQKFELPSNETPLYIFPVGHPQ
jgi:SagB-type dehydrogenase family enzyme